LAQHGGITKRSRHIYLRSLLTEATFCAACLALNRHGKRQHYCRPCLPISRKINLTASKRQYCCLFMCLSSAMQAAADGSSASNCCWCSPNSSGCYCICNNSCKFGAKKMLCTGAKECGWRQR
jgi:hypothetical protein